MMRALFFLLFLSTLFAAPKKYNLSLCALFKSESSYLKEWIEYHKLIGVDHFYLYNNGNLDEHRKVLAPYIRSKTVTLIQWPDLQGPLKNDDAIWSLSTQVSAYENAAKWKALHDTKWLLFLDIDEFLVPCSDSKITDILRKYEDSPGIILSTENYDASSRSVLPPRKLVIEATEMTASQKSLMVEKTIFKPDLCTSISWPPYHCRFKNGKEAMKASKKTVKVNRYENRMAFQHLNNIKKKLAIDRDLLPEKELEELLKLGYEIDDRERYIYRFLPALTAQMK
jgi:hypothetical protein